MRSKIKLLFTTSLFLFFVLPNIYSQCNETEVTITSSTVDYGDEMSWELLDENGNLLETWQGVNNNETSTMLLCLPDGCYSLTAKDSYGDGWNGGTVNFTWLATSMLFELPDGEIDYFFFGINQSACLPIILGCTDPTAINYDPAATVDDGSCVTIPDIVSAQIFDTICYSGPKDNRINWVIQNRSTPSGNGNFDNAQDLRNGLEETLIPAFTSGNLGAKTPYAQYKDFFNLYAVWWPEAPSDATWWEFSIIQNMRDEIFLPWANNETGWVTWFSTTKFGGGGGAGLNRDARVGDGKMFGTDFETMLHEFGHTMPGLLDEYTSSGEWSNNQCFETPNTTEYTIKDSIPWRKWIDDDLPLPTPYNGDFENVVGAFEGGLTNYFGCHRPTAKGCYMGAGGFGEGFGQDLCSPCKQRVICFLYKYVNVIENPSPADPNLSVTGAETMTFSADLIAPTPNTQKYEWFLNGKRVAEGVTSLELTFGTCTNYELKFAVTDTTDLVRYDEKFDEIYPKPYREFVWNIDQSDVTSYDLSSTATAESATCTGEDNGQVSLSIAGGSAPYEVWLDGNAVNNPATDLPPGNHQFTVVDAAGCALSEQINIQQEDLLDLEICATNDNDWELSVASVNYDINAIDLLWSNGSTATILSGVPDGNYSLTASINGCSVMETFQLSTSPEALAVTHNYFPSELGASTGNIYVDVQGGSPNYQIEWFDRLMADRTDDNLSNISASGTTWDHLPEMAFDDDLGTKWLHAVNSNAWVAYEFEAATSIAYYAITSADDVPARDPESWILQGSNDGNNWTDLDTRNNQNFSSRFQRRVFTIDNPAPFTYCRLFVNSSAGEDQIQLQELEFIGADPNAPFLYNPEYDDHFSRTNLAPGEYHYEVSDASTACAESNINIDVYQIFFASQLNVIQDGSCAVTIESPNSNYDYYWLSDETGTELLATGISFEPPSEGNFYVAAALSGSSQWSNNRKGFAVKMPESPMVEDLSGVLTIVDPQANTEYLWYDADICGTPIFTGIAYTPTSSVGEFYIAAKSTIVYPDPIDPTSIDGLILRMDAADLNGDGQIDDPAPATSSILDWSFPTGNNWSTDNWFAYRSNHQNGLGIADWATLWLQQIENSQSNFQTVFMAYEENALSWEETAPMGGLSATIPKYTDATQLYSNNAPNSTLDGSTYLNGQEVDPLNTNNPMEFCVLGSVFTSPSNDEILYTDTHWEGKLGELLFYDNALSDTEMKGVSEFLRQKWISTAELESPRTFYQWGIVSTEAPTTQSISVYPNPTNDWLLVETGIEGPYQIRVYDVQAKLVLSENARDSKHELSVSNLQAGFYFLEIKLEGKSYGVQRFVKTKGQ